MTDERLILAIGRIERAISRLEAEAVAAEDGPNDALRAQYEAIEARHAKLRESTSLAVARIDQLIDAQGR